jgi:hypothetical protein
MSLHDVIDSMMAVNDTQARLKELKTFSEELGGTLEIRVTKEGLQSSF